MKKLLYIFIVLFSALPLFAQAQHDDTDLGIKTSSNITVKSPTTLLPSAQINAAPGDSIASLIASMIGFAAVLSVIGITIGGIMMILSVGKEDKFKKARSIVVYSIVGFALAAGAYLIVKIVTHLSF